MDVKAQATPTAENPSVTPAPQKTEANAGNTQTVLTDTPTATPTAPIVPEKYEFKAPEGSQLDQKAVEYVSSFAKEKKLTNEQAQMVYEQRVAAIKSFEESQQAQFKQAAEKWVSELKADKEIGGENFPKNVEIAKRALAEYGSDDLKRALDETGLGNNPALFKMLWKVGLKMQDDKMVNPGAVPGKTQPRTFDELANNVFYKQTPENG